MSSHLQAEIVTGMDKINNKESAQQAIEILRNDFECKNSIIVTLGSEGVMLWDSETTAYQFVSAPKVSAVDCTGAGDCFVGTLAHCIAVTINDSASTARANDGNKENYDLVGAVKQAVANASESVLRRGTQYSFPNKLIPVTQ